MNDRIRQSILKVLSAAKISPRELVEEVMHITGCSDSTPVKRQLRILLENQDVTLNQELKLVLECT